MPFIKSTNKNEQIRKVITVQRSKYFEILKIYETNKNVHLTASHGH